MRRERFLIPTSGFKGPVVKPEAISREVLDLKSLPSGGLSAGPGEERILHSGPAWLGDVRPAERLTFAGYRPDDETLRLCLVLDIDPEAERLVLFPLAGGRSPLEVLAEPREKGALKRLVRKVGEGGDIPSGSLVLSLSRLLKEGRLGPPLPKPGRVYAVAANYPSHLEEDLALHEPNEKRSVLRLVRPRVFLKHPPPWRHLGLSCRTSRLNSAACLVLSTRLPIRRPSRCRPSGPESGTRLSLPASTTKLRSASFWDRS